MTFYNFIWGFCLFVFFKVKENLFHFILLFFFLKKGGTTDEEDPPRWLLGHTGRTTTRDHRANGDENRMAELVGDEGKKAGKTEWSCWEKDGGVETQSLRFRTD